MISATLRLWQVLVLLSAATGAALALTDTYVYGTAKLLDAGVRSLTVANTGAAGGSQVVGFSPGSGERVRVWFSRTKRPVMGSVSACADPCSVPHDRSIGRVYYWYEYVDSSGNALSPAKVSARHWLEPIPDTASSTLSIPVHVLGGEYYQTGFTFSATSGQAAATLRLWVRAHNLSSAGKGRFKINSGSWVDFNSTNTPQIDPRKFLGGIGQPSAFLGEFAGTVSGVVAGTNEVWFNFTEARERSLGYRLIAWNLIEPDVRINQIVVTGGNLATATTNTSHGYSTGDWVLIYNAPGMYLRFNGYRQITVTGATTFTFAPTNDPGASSVPNATYVVPTERAPGQLITLSAAPGQWSYTTEQMQMHAARLVIPGSSFTQENPATSPNYASPTSDAGRIADGASIWAENTQPTSDPNFDYLAQAGCHHCHTETGLDMKYFRYGNRELRMATLRTGHSELQAENLIAYIRNLSPSTPTGIWPWTPAYQPGPGVSAKSAFNWSSGCGLDCVLTYDSDQWEYLSPDASTKWKYDSWLDRRDIPITQPLLPWNNYILPVHPRQTYSNFFSSTCWTDYQGLRAAIAGGDGDALLDYSLLSSRCMVQGRNTLFENAITAVGLKQNSTWHSSMYGWILFEALKYWELHHEFNATFNEDSIDELATTQYGASANGYLTRGWHRVSKDLFTVGPHKSQTFMMLTPQAFDWLTRLWYEVAMLAGGGNRTARGDDPIDWGYQYIFAAADPTIGPVHMVADLIWQMQSQADLALNADPGPDLANFKFTVETISPLIIRNTSDTLLTDLSTAYVRHALAPYVEKYTTSEWQNANYPMTCTVIDTNGALNFSPNEPCHSIAAMLPRWKFLGVPDADTDRIVAWANAVWPAINFSTHRAATCSWNTSGLHFIACSND